MELETLNFTASKEFHTRVTMLPFKPSSDLKKDGFVY